MASNMQENITRWLIHNDLTFQIKENPENTTHIIVDANQGRIPPIEMFEPIAQPGILVIGAKVPMKNKHMTRYLKFNKSEKERFAHRVQDFCTYIEAISKITIEYGKLLIGVYIVLDDKEKIHQESVFNAMDVVAKMHEKTSNFIAKTF